MKPTVTDADIIQAIYDLPGATIDEVARCFPTLARKTVKNRLQQLAESGLLRKEVKCIPVSRHWVLA